jgi:phage shock protein C
MSTNELGSKKLYRARDGFCFGVAKGLANYSGIPAIWIRIALIITFFATGYFPIVVAYIVAGIVIPKEPVLPPVTPDDQEFYNSYTTSKTMALARLKRKFDQLDRRTQRIESMVTAKEFAWEHRLRTGQ